MENNKLREFLIQQATILAVALPLCTLSWFAMQKAKAERLKHPYIVLVSDSTGSHFIDQNAKTDSFSK
jgi:hypothetical protein